MKPITFTSTAFPVLPQEDAEINPGILGRSVADWIKQSLSGTRFEITEDINEDFGHCLVVHRRPYLLWVGCSGGSDFYYPEDGLDAAVAANFPLASIEWTVWIAAELGFLSRLLRRDDRSRDKADLLSMLRLQLAALPHVTFT